MLNNTYKVLKVHIPLTAPQHGGGTTSLATATACARYSSQRTLLQGLRDNSQDLISPNEQTPANTTVKHLQFFTNMYSEQCQKSLVTCLNAGSLRGANTWSLSSRCSSVSSPPFEHTARRRNEANAMLRSRFSVIVSSSSVFSLSPVRFACIFLSLAIVALANKRACQQ